MQTMRESWTDERLDDLSGRVSEGFGRLDADLRAQRTELIDLRKDMGTEFVAVRREMKAGFDRIDERFARIDGRFGKVDERFGKVDERFERIDARFDSLQRTMLNGFIALFSVMVAGFAALLGLVPT
jgi:predicted nuclease with TOPRIM domain